MTLSSSATSDNNRCFTDRIRELTRALQVDPENKELAMRLAAERARSLRTVDLKNYLNYLNPYAQSQPLNRLDLESGFVTKLKSLLVQADPSLFDLIEDRTALESRLEERADSLDLALLTIIHSQNDQAKESALRYLEEVASIGRKRRLKQAMGTNSPITIEHTQRLEQYVPLLTHSLHEADQNLRFISLAVIERLGPKAKAATPVILKLLEEAKGTTDEDRDYGVTLTSILQQLRNPTQEVLLELGRAITDTKKHGFVRKQARLDLRKILNRAKRRKKQNISTVALVRHLVQALDNQEDEFIGTVVRMLGHLGPQASAAINKLEALKVNATGELRKAINTALRNIQK